MRLVVHLVAWYWLVDRVTQVVMRKVLAALGGAAFRLVPDVRTSVITADASAKATIIHSGLAPKASRTNATLRGWGGLTVGQRAHPGILIE
jgi:hypothetical protein